MNNEQSTPQQDSEQQQEQQLSAEEQQLPAEEQTQVISISRRAANQTGADTDSDCAPSSCTSDASATEDQDAASLAMLGPIVLNKDGTMSRISNWHEMVDKEKESAMRLISKRNKARKKALSELQEEDEGAVAEQIKENA